MSLLLTHFVSELTWKRLFGNVIDKQKALSFKMCAFLHPPASSVCQSAGDSSFTTQGSLMAWLQKPKNIQHQCLQTTLALCARYNRDQRLKTLVVESSLCQKYEEQQISGEERGSDKNTGGRVSTATYRRQETGDRRC